MINRYDKVSDTTYLQTIDKLYLVEFASFHLLLKTIFRNVADIQDLN